MDVDPGGRAGGGVGVEDVGKEEQEEESNGKERSAAQSSVSFSLEKETEGPPPLFSKVISVKFQLHQ